MGGMGYILGGALTGLGRGVAMVGEADMESAKAAAIEELRTRNRRAEIGMQAEANDHNDATRQARGDFYDSRKSARAHGEKLAEIGAQEKREITVAEAKAQLDLSNDKALEKFKKDIDSGEVKESIEGDDGNVYLVYKSGRIANTNVKFRPKQSDSSDEPLLTPRRGGAANNDPLGIRGN